MGSTLTWEPADRSKAALPTELKLILQKRFGSTIRVVRLDVSNISYLQGLADAEVPGALDLIAAIEMHGVVVLNEEF